MSKALNVLSLLEEVDTTKFLHIRKIGTSGAVLITYEDALPVGTISLDRDSVSDIKSKVLKGKPITIKLQLGAGQVAIWKVSLNGKKVDFLSKTTLVQVPLNKLKKVI